VVLRRGQRTGELVGRILTQIFFVWVFSETFYVSTKRARWKGSYIQDTGPVFYEEEESQRSFSRWRNVVVT
jgi:hypothetical protein